MKKKIFKHVKKYLPLLGIIILLYIIYSLDFEKIKTAFLSVQPFFILLALSLTLPRILIRNAAWQMIQKEQKINISYWKSLKILFIGFFYCSITPGYIGHLMRIPYMKEETKQPYGKLFINVFLEVMIRAFSLYIMVTIGLLLVLDLSYQMINILTIWFIWILIVIVILLFFIKKERGEKLLLILVKYLIPTKFKKDTKNFFETFYSDFPKMRKLIAPFLLGAITWVIVFSQEYLYVLSLGLNIPYFYFLLLFPLANVAGFIPITVGGLGVREAAGILIFTTLFAVSKEEILVVSLLGFLTVEVFTGLIGFLLSLTDTVKIGKNDIKPSL